MAQPQDGRDSQETQELLARYGITRVPADIFQYRQYRYGDLKDAVAQAERDRASGS